jgi:hypothetical protein
VIIVDQGPVISTGIALWSWPPSPIWPAVANPTFLVNIPILPNLATMHQFRFLGTPTSLPNLDNLGQIRLPGGSKDPGGHLTVSCLVVSTVIVRQGWLITWRPWLLRWTLHYVLMTAKELAVLLMIPRLTNIFLRVPISTEDQSMTRAPVTRFGHLPQGKP